MSEDVFSCFEKIEREQKGLNPGRWVMRLHQSELDRLYHRLKTYVSMPEDHFCWHDVYEVAVRAHSIMRFRAGANEVLMTLEQSGHIPPNSPEREVCRQCKKGRHLAFKRAPDDKTEWGWFCTLNAEKEGKSPLVDSEHTCEHFERWNE